MATVLFAMWLQSSDPGSDQHLMMIFLGVISLAIVMVAIIIVVIAIKGLATIKELGATALEVKTKMMPVLDEVMGITKTSRELLQDAAPKVKLITENLVKVSDTLVETSKGARATAQQVEITISDANTRAQRQVARVDGMVTAALTTTAEVMETISHGIRVPAQKIAVMMTQAKIVGEGLLTKVKTMVDGSPFGTRY